MKLYYIILLIFAHSASAEEEWKQLTKPHEIKRKNATYVNLGSWKRGEDRVEIVRVDYGFKGTEQEVRDFVGGAINGVNGKNFTPYSSELVKENPLAFCVLFKTLIPPISQVQMYVIYTDMGWHTIFYVTKHHERRLNIKNWELQKQGNDPDQTIRNTIINLNESCSAGFPKMYQNAKKIMEAALKKAELKK